MQILHILPSTNKTVVIAYIKFLRENFDLNEHKIYIHLNENLNNKEFLDKEFLEYHKVRTLNPITTKILRKLIKNHDKVIVHYLQFRTSLLFGLLFQPSVFKKIIWVAWGADLYQWRKELKGSAFRKTKNIIKNTIAYMFRKRVLHFVGIFPPDIDFFKAEFSSIASTNYAPYVGIMSKDIPLTEYDNINLLDKIKGNNVINIQVGHSSSQALNHLDVLQQLVKFKNENIKIFLPLNYGDHKYRDKIIKEANSVFGDKVVCFTERMSLKDYYSFLSSVDIAIFNTNRQIGLGNIIPLIAMKKKIFMPIESVMFEYFKSLNIEITNYHKINEMLFETFIEQINTSENDKYFKKITNKMDQISMWDQVFKIVTK